VVLTGGLDTLEIEKKLFPLLGYEARLVQPVASSVYRLRYSSYYLIRKDREKWRRRKKTTKNKGD
jgi:hypothetical protein